MFFLAGAIAQANQVTCIGASGSVLEGFNSTISFTCGSMTFSSFRLPDAEGGAIGRVDIVGASFNPMTGAVTLQLDPNLDSAQDELFGFEVDGGVSRAGVSMSGNDAHVSEQFCSSPVAILGPLANQCPHGTQLAQVADYSGNPSQPAYSSKFDETAALYVMKDIQTGNGNPYGAGQVSILNEVFIPYQVPEPLSFILLGSGLAVVGLLRRRRA